MTDRDHPAHEQTIAQAARQGPHPLRKYVWLLAFLAVIGGSVATWSVTHKTAPPETIPGKLGN
jgi:hypothetical protein